MIKGLICCIFRMMGMMTGVKENVLRQPHFDASKHQLLEWWPKQGHYDDKGVEAKMLTLMQLLLLI